MKTYLENIRSALDSSLGADESVLIIGEDLEDPYGGAFKVTKGLSTKYPGRVINTPISEPGITGVANGLALRGMRPVVEIMFGDFVTLAADQIINHAAKFSWMYNDKVKVPLTIRMPMGGGRGYGPTHSQSIEKIFFGIPGLSIISPGVYHDVRSILEKCIKADYPKLFVEYKRLYPVKLQSDFHSLEKDGLFVKTDEAEFPSVVVANDHFDNAQITVLSYGGVVPDVIDAVKEVILEDEISCEVILPSLISPFDYRMLMDSVKKTGRLLVVEEASISYGFGSEILARMSEAAFKLLRCPPRRVAGLDCPIGSSRTLESEILPDKSRIKNALKEIAGND